MEKLYPKSRPITETQGSWYAILAVAIGAFALVTSEFLPVGVSIVLQLI
jgi:predicted MFS family arabinose efflux permease